MTSLHVSIKMVFTDKELARKFAGEIKELFPTSNILFNDDDEIQVDVAHGDIPDEPPAPELSDWTTEPSKGQWREDEGDHLITPKI